MPAPGPTALVDAVDERNEPIAVVPRGEVFARHANFRTVHVLVFNHSGEVLLQQLSARRDRHPGKWGSSVAGYLHAGEQYEQAASRRLLEELGLATEVVPLGVLAMADDGVTKFVGVFVTVANDPRIALPEHIAALEFRSVGAVREQLAKWPADFTESFREVFAFVEKANGGVRIDAR
jgi:isopentenyl-diphosphate delta-isomerase